MVSIVPTPFSLPIGVFNASGCYALVGRGVVLYVGQSLAIYSRLASHSNNFRRVAKGKRPYGNGMNSWQPVVKFDEVWIYPCQPSDMASLEIQLIQEFQPRYNKNMKRAPTTPEEKKLLLNVPAIQVLLGRTAALKAQVSPFKLKPLNAA